MESKLIRINQDAIEFLGTIEGSSYNDKILNLKNMANKDVNLGVNNDVNKVENDVNISIQTVKKCLLEDLDFVNNLVNNVNNLVNKDVNNVNTVVYNDVDIKRRILVLEQHQNEHEDAIGKFGMALKKANIV